MARVEAYTVLAMPSTATSTPVDVAPLPPFSNHRAVCARCGARFGVRVHFDRGCDRVSGGEHFHRLCNRCGHEWIETCSEAVEDKAAT